MTHASTAAQSSQPQLGRRELIGGVGAAALATVLVGPGRGWLDVLPFVGDSFEPFNRSPLVERIGETFRVTAGVAKGAALEIREIAELPAGAVADAEHQFVVRFAGVAGPELVQETYEFATQSFGDLPLFVTPMTDPGATEAIYEAIVNRFVPVTNQLGGQR